MASRRFISPVLFLSLLLSACGLGEVKAPAPTPLTVVNKYHKVVESTYCLQCHIRQGERYQPKAFDPVKACQDCHPPAGHNHPLSVTSSRPVAGLPLYDQKIACLTCHDPHNQEGYRALLRKETTQLCQSCHQK